MCHPETKRVLRGESLKNDALVMEMRRNNQNNDDSRQILYEVTDSSGKKSRYYGAYKKLAFGDIVILTTVPFDTILEGVITTRKNNIYLTCIVFFLSVMFILFFARFGISRHLRRLTEAADEIKNGNFETPVISMLNTKRRDEIGVLNQSTKDEREFLNLFAKFTNKGVARAIARKFQWNILISGNAALNYLGLSTQVPMRLTYFSDGPTRQYEIGSRTIEFKHISLKEARFANIKSEIIVQALRELGAEHITAEIINKIRNFIPASERNKILKDTQFTTDWIHDKIKLICSEGN